MRTSLLSVLVIVIGLGALAQAAPDPRLEVRPGIADGAHPHPPAPHCCREKVWDKNGKEIGDFIAWDTRSIGTALTGFVAYRVKGGDAVTLLVTAEYISGLQQPGGGNTFFTTPDCSGNTMFATINWPPLAKRYAMVLSQGPYALSATSAWLWATDPLPARVIPTGTVFHSQWTDSGTCAPWPAPGYTVPSPGGFWLHRVEDLYAKYKRPFYIDY